jgi:nucleoside-diphosphate-sugar epimerase
MKLAGSRVVVTGAGGFLGAAVCRCLRRSGNEVIPWLRTDVDLLDKSAVRTALADARPAGVVHLAAAGVRTPGSDDPRIALDNVRMTEHVVSAMEPGSTVVVAGSMTEYGRSGTLSEDDPCAPQTTYNRGKHEAGLRAIELGAQHGVRVTVARLFHLFGPGEPEHRLFPSLLRALPRGESVALSDGLQRRDNVHVGDAAEVLRRLLLADPALLPDGSVVNVGTGVGILIRDAAEWIAESLGANPSLLHFGARDRSPADQNVLIADTRRLVRAIGTAPPCRLMPGLDFRKLMQSYELEEW